VFCAIVANRAPASIVYRDPVTLAFMDVNPVRPGHLLVIPTAHRAQIWEPESAAGAGR
jgi:diadenosine tetraphosphate (Ap4A) HIT family hydrolase